MFANVVRHHLRFHKDALGFRAAGLLSRRRFSVLSTHASFPATLYRFQTQRSSGLSDYKESGDSEDGLELSADGLEWVRTSYDYYVEGLEEGQSTSDAMILSVGKGTFIPRSLTLLHEHSSRFSLQPSHPMKTKELNDLLSEFYRQNATFTDAEEWMERNEYHESTTDEDTGRWMHQ